MACFLVPTAEAIITTIAAKKVTANETEETAATTGKISWKTKFAWLNSMLWGGAILLCLEHIWHGEVVLYPPFLTAMYDAGDTVTMLHEMGTVGVGMAVLVTAVWLVMVLAADSIPAIRAALSSKDAKEMM